MSLVPFVVGRPLRADEPIFGRDEVLRQVFASLKKLNSCNIVGDRRMGKSSLKNHIIGNKEKYLERVADDLPLLFVSIDLQGTASSQKFYSTVIRESLVLMRQTVYAHSREIVASQQHLFQVAEATFEDADAFLRRLRGKFWPVLIIDEFERLLEDSSRTGFAYPEFFNALSSLLSAGLLSMVVLSRRPLANYFSDPRRPNSLTSTFPRYFPVITLETLSDSDADALLLQNSAFPLKLNQVTLVKKWANGHPCLLQCAGAAMYEANEYIHTNKWAKRRYHQLITNSCMTGSMRWAPYELVHHLLTMFGRFVFWTLPVGLGRLARNFGIKVDDIAALIFGWSLIILLLLLLLGVVSGGDIYRILRNQLGFQ